jgi:hypothetical protein
VIVAPTQTLPMPPAQVEYLVKQYQAEVQQRINRARWIAAEGLSAIEAQHIPLDYDPDAQL